MFQRRLTIKEMCVASGETIRAAAEQMNENCLGVVFVTDSDRLVGVVTDGDFRRSMLTTSSELDSPVDTIMNRKPSTLSVGAGAEETYFSLKAGIEAGCKVFPRIDGDNVIRGFSYSNDWGLIPIAEPELTGNEAAYVLQCIQENWISSNGPFVRKFELDFAEFTGLRHPVAVSNGTVALTLALQALGIDQGDPVIVPSTTFAATANAVVAAGGVPIMADVDPVTWGLSPKTVEQLISARTWGMIPVHLYGSPCDVLGLRELADRYGMYMVEDCAEAIGTQLGNSHVGCVGDASTFSFFGNKTLTTGEGGMVFFRDAQIEQKARILRDHGMSTTRKYWHEMVGFNYRLTNIQAAIGVGQVERAQQLVETKIKIGELYDSGLKGINGITMMKKSPFGQSSFWLIACLLDEELAKHRDLLMELLAADGIEVRISFPALHGMPAFARYAQAGAFPIAESIEKRGVCLPNTPRMTEKSVAHILQSLTDSMRIVNAEAQRNG